MTTASTTWKHLRAFGTALAKPIRWLASFFNPQDASTSMKRGNMAASTGALVWGFVKVVGAIAKAISAGTWHATTADVLLVAAIAVPLASLAGAAYLLRADGTISVGGQTTPPSQPKGAPEPEEGDVP